MSISTDRATLTRLNKEISNLQVKEAGEIRKVADASKKMNTANDRARKARSAGQRSMYISTATRESRNVEAAQARRSQYSSDIAKKSQEASRVQERISKAEEAERRTIAATQEKNRRMAGVTRKNYEQRVSQLETQLAEQLAAQATATAPFTLTVAAGEPETHDVFICHAWKDKADFTNELAVKARDAGLKVWYDDFTINWGESVRQKIDAGLASSYFGVVVLSPNFFDRPWTNYELDGLIQKDLSKQGRLLPIWHRLDQDDVAKHSPSLAGRLAIKTADVDTDGIVAELVLLRDRYKAAASAGSGPA